MLDPTSMFSSRIHAFRVRSMFFGSIPFHVLDDAQRKTLMEKSGSGIKLIRTRDAELWEAIEETCESSTESRPGKLAEINPCVLSSLVQHGRLKVRTSAEQAAAKQKEQEKKMKIYNEATKCIFTKKKNDELDEEALQLTEQLLSSNPDFGTLWNFRREIFLKHKKENGFDDTLVELCIKELSFLQMCLKVNPKSYGVWHHRQWINEFLPNAKWKQELQLCDLFLSFDERNFHCWDYRRIVVNKANITAEEEFKFSTDKIVENFSNYSSWHYRSKLLPLIHPDPSGNPERIEESALLKEFELAQNAFFTDPNDQSAWFYHRWLLGRAQIPMDITCMYVKIFSEDVTLLLQFSQPIKLSSCTTFVRVNEDDIKGTWKNVFSTNQPCQTWMCDFSVEENIDSITVTVPFMDNKMTRKISLEEGEKEAWQMSSDCHLLRAELTAIHSSLLENELDSCKMLLEEEPDNKWTILTIVLLMRALDPLTYEDKTEEYLIKLSEVDQCRRGYYHDLREKFRLEDAIEKHWKRITNSDVELQRSINLSNMGLTQLCHMHQLMLMKEVDISANNLTSLDHCNVLRCVKVLKASDNKLTCLSKKQPLRLEELEELDITNNCIVDLEGLDALRNCSRLVKLNVKGNKVCNLLDYRIRIGKLCPSIRILDNEVLNS